MAFFRNKEHPPEKTPEKKHQSLLEVVHKRVITAEGWRRRLAAKAKLAKPEKK